MLQQVLESLPPSVRHAWFLRSRNTGKRCIELLRDLSYFFPYVRFHLKKSSVFTCNAYWQTKQIHVTLCFKRRSRGRWNVWQRWFNVIVSMMIVLSACESCSGRFMRLVKSAICRKKLQTVLIIRSSGVKRVWEPEEVIVNTYRNTWWSYIYIFICVYLL